MRPQTTHEPTRAKPTGEQMAEALATLAASIAWAEWDSEPERVIEDPNSYFDGLMDTINGQEMGGAEICYLAMGQLGIQEYPGADCATCGTRLDDGFGKSIGCESCDAEMCSADCATTHEATHEGESE